MRLRLALSILLALSVWARPASASTSFGVGVDWIEGGGKDINLTLGADSYLTRNLSLGVRGGVAFFRGSRDLGVPMDLQLRLRLQRIYFEGMVGPWFIFDSEDSFYWHLAFGFGIEAGRLAVGLEFGRIEDVTIIGPRVLVRF